MINGHEYVDLGLPSGTLWATCNVGANSPEEYGDYFAWGETEPNDYYYWNWYKWGNGEKNALTKYNYYSSRGIVDDKIELELEDDAAYMNWGRGWIMPSSMQISELLRECVRELVLFNDVEVIKLTSKYNGNYIIIPLSGHMFYNKQYSAGEQVDLWTRELDYPPHPRDSNDDFAVCRAKKITFTEKGGMSCLYERFRGYPCRPVVMNLDATGVILNAENFPDTSFRQLLSERFKVSEFDELSTETTECEITAEQIASTANLKITGKAISDLTGIENFTSLKNLFCQDNQLISLDVTKNTELEYLDCSNNQLISLTADNANLISLYCHHNELSMLNVSNLPALRTLDCRANSLTLLNLSNNRLFDLYCNGNLIKDESMDTFISYLPRGGYVGGSYVYIVDTKDENEGNVCTKKQVEKMKTKNWNVCDYHSGEKDTIRRDGYVEISSYKYEGSDDTTEIYNFIPDSDNHDNRWFSIDGKNIGVEPRKKGIYIRNGKKVMK